MVAIGYLGIGGWLDYTKVESVEIKAYGTEAKAAVSILGIPTIHKFGFAFDFNNDEIGTYYNVSIPLNMEL